MDFFNEFMPHGHCYLWTPSILWTTVVSDAVIAISYFSIPLALVYLVRRRADLPFSWVFVLFGVFILACGTGHVLDVWNTWRGDYGVEALVNAITALASIGTAVLLWPLLPRALALPSPRQLRAANEALRAEVRTREEAERALQTQAQELALARDAARAANRAKSQFLANMSHEIRTPLNAVIGLSEILLTTELSETQREHVHTVIDSGDVLLNVVNDILDYSRIEAGRMELESMPFELEDVVGDTLRSFAVRADRKGLELLCRIDADVPPVLRGDPGRLRQVLTNLVSNAITYTERGEVEVSVSCEPGGPAGTLRFAVRDTGIGIGADDLERIFESFEQADPSTARRFGGTGLGLSISRGIVEKFDGRLAAESAPGRGSVFWFTARFEVSDERPASQDAEPLPLEGARVLVVDDNATNRQIIAAQVGRRGMRAVLTESAAEGLSELRRAAESGEPFPLLLTDYNMPGLDGLALVESIRADAAFDELRILMLTSAGLSQDLRRIEQLRIAARIMKPVKQGELLRVIERVMSGRDRLTAPRSGAPPSGASEPELPPLRILLAEDSLPNQKVAFAILEGGGHAVVAAKNGEEALALFRAQEFDVVLMDVQMPVMDGLAATAAIRDTEAATGGRVPIVAMTAHALKGDREKCIAAGMDGYVAKPIRRELLFAELGRALAPKRRVVDWTTVLKQVGGDPAVLREIVQAYLDETRENLGQLPGLVASQTWSEVKRLTHTIRGAMRTFAGSEAVRVAQLLEEAAEAGADDAAERVAMLRSAVGPVLREFERFLATGRLDPDEEPRAGG